MDVSVYCGANVVPVLANSLTVKPKPVVMALQHYICESAAESRPVLSSLILTIDTDIVLQMSGVWARNVQLASAQVWQAPAARFTEGQKVTKFQENPLFWNIRPGKPPRFRVSACGKSSQWIKYNKRPELMLWRQFCWMAVGGVDYCKGVGRFGWFATATDNTKTVGWWLTRPNPS